MMQTIQHPKRILITSPHNLGDFVAKVPFIRLLKQLLPKSQLILLSRPYIEPLVQCIKEVEEIYDFEDFFSQKEEDIVENLKAMKIDVCIHILSINHSLGPDVIGYAQKAGIPNRVGNIRKSLWTLFRKKNFGLTHNLRERRILPKFHEFEWNLLPLQFFGFPIKFENLHLDELLMTDSPFEEKSPHLKEGVFNLIVHPGSHGNAKEWPESHYKQLIEELNPSIRVILTGSETELYRFNTLHFKEREVLDLRGQLSLEEFIHLISEVDGVLAASTGPIHIASLFGVRTLALFPKQNLMGASVWGPRGAQAEVLKSKKICSSCQKRLTDFNKKLCTCMEDIQVSQVKERLETWVEHEDFV